ncbi:MAG TPA: MerR family transcriptional regulator [Longimicrobiales bacterium]|nr:MerR family transcriptional regulator [Longimicrobiales bacterium]
MRVWKVGELAEATGLTVRTLHHYDEIGLLTPSARTAAGYRLYAAEDIERLQRIRSLRELGLSLEEIRECLARPGGSLGEVIGLHVGRLREEIALKARLLGRLERMAARLTADGSVSAEEFLETMEEMAMHEKYFTAEQLERIRQQGERVGAARIKEVEAAWPVLIAEVKAEMEKGTDPTSEPVLALARRWKGLVEEFTGGDAGVAAGVRELYRNEPAVRERAGFDPAVWEYIGRALRALR